MPPPASGPMALVARASARCIPRETRGGLGVAVGGDDQVAEVAQVVVAGSVEAAGLDGHGLELADAVDGDGDRTATDRAVDPRLGEPLLGALELLLHLLGLLEETLQVETTGLTAAAEGVEGVLGHGFTLSSLTGGGSPR